MSPAPYHRPALGRRAPVLFASLQARQGGAQLFSEFVATFGLLAVIWGCAHLRSGTVAFAVGGYITAAYWFTAATALFGWLAPVQRPERETAR